MAPKDYEKGLTQARLKSMVHYEPETGVFTWLVSRPNGVKIGSTAGCLHKASGYLNIKIDGHAYTASRLAWLYMTGDWPECYIDHRDTDRANNSWNNLRQASHAENVRNRTAHRNSFSGLKGVSCKTDARRTKKWEARIRIDGVLKSLGHFAHREEANAAYYAAAKLHHGAFARA